MRLPAPVNGNPPPHISVLIDGSHKEPLWADGPQPLRHALDRAGIAYEVLWHELGDTASSDISEEGTPSSPAAAAERWRAMLARARGRLLVLCHPGACAPQALDYLLPLAGRFPVVWGYSPGKTNSRLEKLGQRLYRAATHLLLGIQVPNCALEDSLVIVHREKFASIVPRSVGTFAGAEMLSRMAAHGWTAAAVPVPASQQPQSGRPSYGRLVLECIRYWWSQLRFAGKERRRAGNTAAGVGALFIALLAAFVLFPKLNQPLLDPDEGRQAEIPREMLAHQDWLRPRMLGLPYYEKPPLQYWLTAGAYALFGAHGWTARLTPASAAWLTVLLTFWWAQRALGLRAAFLGAVGLCLTPGFVVLGRTAVLDSLLACCVAASWYSGHVAVSRPRLRWRWWIVSAAACGLGVLAKGPVALALVMVPVGLYQALTVTAAPVRWRPWIAYCLVVSAIAAPWFLMMALVEPAYVSQFLWRANLVRFFQPYDHQQPWWFYIPVLFAATLPWSFLWPSSGYFLLCRRRRLGRLRLPALGFCVLAVAWCGLFFSLAGCKSPAYVGPLLAPLALLQGACVDVILFHPAGWRDQFLQHARQQLPRRAVFLVLWVCAGCYAATAFFDWQPWGWALAKAAVTLALAAGWWQWGRAVPPRWTWAACGAVMLIFVTLSLREVTSGFASRRSPAIVARLVRKWPHEQTAPVVSFGHQWNSACFYLGRDVVRLVDDAHPQALLDFLKHQPKTLVLVESGPPLDAFLATLPASLHPEVHLPRRIGQPAVIIVRQGF